jgi:hypothetical protein
MAAQYEAKGLMLQVLTQSFTRDGMGAAVFAPGVIHQVPRAVKIAVKHFKGEYRPAGGNGRAVGDQLAAGVHLEVHPVPPLQPDLSGGRLPSPGSLDQSSRLCPTWNGVQGYRQRWIRMGRSGRQARKGASHRLPPLSSPVPFSLPSSRRTPATSTGPSESAFIVCTRLTRSSVAFATSLASDADWTDC